MSSNRFKEVKKQSKHTGGKSRYRPLTQAKRRHTYFKTGKGSVGLLVRRPRVVRVIRKLREIQNERYLALSGIENDGKKKQVLYKGYTEAVVGALDAYANRIMEMAARFAKGRPKKKLRIEDLESAIWAIKKISRQ